MKIAVQPVFFKIVPILVFLLEYSFLPAQNYKEYTESKERKDQEIEELNKIVLSDKQKQAELLSFYRDSLNNPLQRDDTLALYLADLDILIDISKKQNIPYQIKLMDDCRDLIRNDLRE